MKKALRAFPIVILLSLFLSVNPAWAAMPDGAGNIYLEDGDSGNNLVCTSDLFWFGRTLDLQKTQIAGEAILAGETVNISNSLIVGSLRAAGNTLQTDKTTVNNNITVAGNTIKLGADTVARGVYAAGNELRFDGTATYLNLAGAQVVLNGTVNGDVNIDAETVTIGENAVVTGQLSITANTEPSIPATAKIGAMSFTQNSNTAVDGAEETAQSMLKIAVVTQILLKMAYRIIVYLLIALFFCWVLQKTLSSSVEMIQRRPAPMIISGIVALIVMPIVLLILCATVIGMPLAAAFSLLMIVVTLLAMPFTGVALGQKFFSRINRWLAGLIGAAIIAVLSIIPFLGLLIRFCCMAYVVGYFLQVMFANIKTTKQPNAPRPPMNNGGMPQATPQTGAMPQATPQTGAVAPIPNSTPPTRP